MGINLTKNEEQLTSEVMSKINLSKDKNVLGNNVVNLSKTIINLSKKAEVDLGSVKAQVVLVVDYSGSMRQMYDDGTVQRVLNKMVPLGLTFDDNGEVEVFRFSSNFKQFKSLTINNYDNYVNDVLYTGSMGGTYYSPVLEEIKRQYIDGKEQKKGLLGLFKKNNTVVSDKADTNPVFVVFVTDGDNSDHCDTDHIIRELSKHNCFIQFIGVGDAIMRYLDDLDNLSDRECDNTGFVKFTDIDSVSDSELYNAVLEQFADWLKVKGF